LYNFDSNSFPTAGTFTYGTLSSQGLTAVLKLLTTRTDTNILSNPSIVTLDNQPAKITVGSQFPIPQYTYNEEQAKLQVSGFEFKDIGIIFEVTPHVNSVNLVTLDLHPKITDSDLSKGSADLVEFENTSLPIISVQETTTKVMVQNGQTLVIAGLIKDKTTSIKKKVPILGDLPFIGKALFRSEVDSKDKSELLIFLTPHIITASNEPAPVDPPAKEAPSQK
jgi:type II secretory pathway component GspD/PulD (secretin)